VGPTSTKVNEVNRPGFAELAAWCAGLLDRVAAGLPPERVAARERAFRTNLDHELAFWDA
jgi:thiaminase